MVYASQCREAGEETRLASKLGRQQGHDRIAAVAELARYLGLRFREASLLDVRTALKQANELGRINVTEGTKGGRGRGVNRWVAVSGRAKQSLHTAARTTGDAGNLIPTDQRFVEWRNHACATWHIVSAQHDLSGFHDLRAAYACERYHEVTGHAAPVIAGLRAAAKERNQAARQIIAQELGHGRSDVVAAYVGGSK